MVTHTAKASSLAESSRRMHQSKERMVRRLAKAGGADHVQVRGQGYSTDVYECSTAYFTGHLHWKATLNYSGDSVKIAVDNLPTEQALRVLRLLKSMRQ